MKIKQLLEMNYSSFTDAQKNVAHKILVSPEKIIKMNCSEFASYSNVSTSLVISFAKKIGLEGWDELKYAVKYAFDDKNIHNDFLTEYLYTVQETHTLVEQKSLSLTLNLLHKSESVFIFSRSSSASLSHDFYNKLNKVRENVYFYSDKSDQIKAVKNLPPEAFSIYISNSGSSSDLENLLTLNKNRNPDDLLISTVPNGTLSKYFTNKLTGINIERNYIFYRDIPNYSKVSLNYILDLLFYKYFSSHQASCEEHLIELKSLIEKK